jgi:hypothetical protein
VLTLAIAVKTVAEIALLAFAGQFLLSLLAGAKRDTNFVYQLFGILTKPFVRVMRTITPKAVIDRHMPVAAFVALLSVWMLSVLAKVELCVRAGVAAALCK